jgi:hypothetical protein
VWWSRKNSIEASANIKEAMAEGAPLSQEINELLVSKGVSTWTAIVALAACLGSATAYATQVGPAKGYLRVAHRFLDSAFWVACGEFKRGAKG